MAPSVTQDILGSRVAPVIIVDIDLPISPTSAHTPGHASILNHAFFGSPAHSVKSSHSPRHVSSLSHAFFSNLSQSSVPAHTSSPAPCPAQTSSPTHTSSPAPCPSANQTDCQSPSENPLHRLAPISSISAATVESKDPPKNTCTLGASTSSQSTESANATHSFNNSIPRTPSELQSTSSTSQGQQTDRVNSGLLYRSRRLGAWLIGERRLNVSLNDLNTVVPNSF